jgi:hypothetical protein
MELKVHDCDTCPFVHNDAEYGILDCGHPNSPDDNELSYLSRRGVPDWCPLKKESATIILEENG